MKETNYCHEHRMYLTIIFSTFSDNTDFSMSSYAHLFCIASTGNRMEIGINMPWEAMGNYTTRIDSGNWYFYCLISNFYSSISTFLHSENLTLFDTLRQSNHSNRLDDLDDQNDNKCLMTTLMKNTHDLQQIAQRKP